MSKVDDFNEVVEDGVTNEIAAAIIVLAMTISDLHIDYDLLGHGICMGMRKGLFGSYSSDNESIKDGIRIMGNE